MIGLSLLLLFFGIAMGQYELSSAMHETLPCGTQEQQERLRTIMQDAIDEALKEHIKNTFEVWMKDDKEQPARAARGIRGGVNAYIQSHNFLQTWKLMPCATRP